MDIILAFAITFIFLMIGVYEGMFLAYPLLLGLAVFIFLALRKGFGIKQTLLMAYKGAGKALPLIKIFLLIGAITAIWMAGGTISGLIYYAVKLLNPRYFILFAFAACSLVSFVLGTSLGTTGTIGVALIVLARSGHVNINLAAGAIISGAFFGDRCSPMSSSASLVASVTGTDIYRNIRNMLKTAAIPFLIAAAIYLWFSISTPLLIDGSVLGKEISGLFNTSPVMLLPAAVILVLALLKVDVKLAMLASILAASAEAMLFQHRNVWDLAGFALYGFKLEDGSFLSGIIREAA